MPLGAVVCFYALDVVFVIDPILVLAVVSALSFKLDVLVSVVFFER